MTTCVAFGCKNRGARKRKDQPPGNTFHVFPKNQEKRNTWIKAVRREGWIPSARICLCSDHFEEQCFDRTSLSCVRLRENAVPTIFPAHPLHLKKVIKTRKPTYERSDIIPVPGTSKMEQQCTYEEECNDGNDNANQQCVYEEKCNDGNDNANQQCAFEEESNDGNDNANQQCAYEESNDGKDNANQQYAYEEESNDGNDNANEQCLYEEESNDGTISKKYINIRLHFIAKRSIDKSENIRNFYNKLILFKGH